MDMVGKHIVFWPQHRRALEQALTRCAALAVWRINAGNPQNLRADTGRAAIKTQRAFRVDAAHGTRRAGVDAARFVDPGPGAVAIDTAGRAIHQLQRRRAPAQRAQQGSQAWIAPAFAGRRRQIEHALRKTGQSRQAAGTIQITQQGQHALAAQLGQARCR